MKEKTILTRIRRDFEAEANYANKCMALNMNLIYTGMVTTHWYDKYSLAMNPAFQCNRLNAFLHDCDL